MKTVGVMRVCNEFDEEIDLTIGSLAAFCDEVCFLTDHVTNPKVLSAMSHCNNLVETRESSGEWNHYYTVDQAYRLADDHEADWIIMEDQDELLPFDKLHYMIKAAYEHGDDTIFLPVAHCWGTPDRIVWPKLNRTAAHCKIYRGKNTEFSIVNGGGSCIPSSPHKMYWGEYPNRHLAFMTETTRQIRSTIPSNRAPSEPWMNPPPPTFPWRPDWTINQWMELEV